MTEKKHNVFTKSLLTVACATLISAAPVASADPLADIADAFKNGTTKVSFRLRYETVDQDNARSDAEALTLKSRITFKTADYKGFGLLLEADDVTNLGIDQADVHPSGAVGDNDFSVIADDEYTEINQVYLSYAGIADTTVKYGRQRILLDNQRFVGGVGFRQNEQTYDALSFTNTSLPDTKVYAAYVTNVNRIFGEGAPGGDAEQDTTLLLNASYSGLPFGKLTAYGYLIESDIAAQSSDTFGLRFAGKTKVSDDVTALYEAEYAIQDDNSATPDGTDIDADYYNLVAGAKVAGVTAKLGYEVLEGDADGGFFRTPFATLHKFQGWADVFLGGGQGNINSGIEDLSFTVAGKVAGVKLVGVYHDYDSETGSTGSLGSEIGFLIAKKFSKNYGLSLKYADYDADDFGVDTEKLWLTATANF